MSWTRREFLQVIGAGVAAPSFGGRAPHGEPFPFDRLVTAFRNRASWPRISPTGLSRPDYLRVIGGIVRRFAREQDARGAILDPFEHREKQYATPAFALAGAVLVSAGRDTDLLPAVTRAMDAASADLAAGTVADNHSDFFTVLLMHADLVLGRAARRTPASWRPALRSVRTEVYRYQPDAKAVHNWNMVAAAGEWLRTRERYAESSAWVDRSLARQLEHFTSAGMYRDPNDPIAYDHFARLWGLDLVAEGYRGVHEAALTTCLERGAWMSLFMQSPHGEMPCGGRSAHHQWNEAEQAVTFETFAARLSAKGDRRGAEAFKRAARVSLRSILRWIRPEGELWIAKNRVDPARRHGYEEYSFHSQYNLLAAAMLALAWLRADDRIGERPCPADAGGYAFELQPAFHKVVATAGGTYVEVDTGADLHYNPTGILRIHNRRWVPELISDGVTPDCAYAVPAKPTRAVAVGPVWQNAAGEWTSLASHGGSDLDAAEVTVREATDRLVDIDIVYRGRLRGGATTVRESIRVSDAGAEITHVIEGDVQAVRQTIPVLATDGSSETALSLAQGAAEVRRDGGGVKVLAVGQAAIEWRHEREAGRNGFVQVVQSTGRGRSARCVVGPLPRG
jgi:hypothetical protein